MVPVWHTGFPHVCVVPATGWLILFQDQRYISYQPHSWCHNLKNLKSSVASGNCGCVMQYFVSTDDTTLLFCFFLTCYRWLSSRLFTKKKTWKSFLTHGWCLWGGGGAFFWCFAFRSQVSWYKEKQCKEQAAVDEWTLFNMGDWHLGLG